MEFEQIGKYKILAEIGQGAMGVVYKAHDPILNRYVAIKTISASLGSDDELRKRFHREAQAAARLNHSNIITVFDFGEERGKIYMAMELLEGTDLKDVMTAGTVGTLDDKLGIMEQILDGLAFAHAKEVVHRDLKPGNIHIQPNGQIKIMDFGLARLGSSEMTQAGVVMGTPNYMSPEQVLGEKVDSRSDIFAMGAVFYELLTNHKPFEAESMHGVLFQVVHKEPQAIRKWIPDLPPVLVQVVEKCLLKDKNKRFQHAGEMREALLMVRQALQAGRVAEATLDMESGKVFFDAVEFLEEDGSAPGSWPPQGEGQGPGAPDYAAQPAVNRPASHPPASRSHPSLAGRSRTQVNRQATQVGFEDSYEPPPSRTPLYVGAAALVAILVGLVVWMTLRPKPVDSTFLLLLDTQKRLAQRDLDDKKYKDAIADAEGTLKIADSNPSSTHPAAVRALDDVRKVLAEAREKLTNIEGAATGAEDAFAKGQLDQATQSLRKLLELDPQHPVAKELSGKLNQQFQAQADDARRSMAQAKDQAEKVISSATGEFRAEGRTDFGKANDAVDEATAAVRTKAYAQATQKFLEARDAYDRARRAVEAKIAEKAKDDDRARRQLKVPAEEARAASGRAKIAAEQAGATTQEAFKTAVAQASEGDGAMNREDYLKAKQGFDDARIGFERARQIASRPTPPPTTLAPPTTTLTSVTTTLPAPTTTTLPTVTTTLLPAIGRLEPGTSQMCKAAFCGVDTEFKLNLEFESANAAVRPGESYSIKVYATNQGQKSARIREVSINVRLDARGTPQKVSPLTKSADPGQRVLVAELKGTWPESIRSWVTAVDVYGEKDEYAQSKIALKR